MSTRDIDILTYPPFAYLLDGALPDVYANSYTGTFTLKWNFDAVVVLEPSSFFFPSGTVRVDSNNDGIIHASAREAKRNEGF